MRKKKPSLVLKPAACTSPPWSGQRLELSFRCELNRHDIFNHGPVPAEATSMDISAFITSRGSGSAEKDDVNKV